MAAAVTMTIEEVGALSSRVLDEVERAIVGKRDAARADPARNPRRRARAARGLPGLAKTLIARSFAQATTLDVLAHPVHARPDAVGRHGLVDLQPADRRVRVPPGPDLREPPARGRDQPRPAEDAGRAARGDAGAAGDDRRADAPARAAVPRARDAEPDRVRGHVSAAGGAARPLPASGSASAIRSARTSGRCSRAGWSARSTRSS